MKRDLCDSNDNFSVIVLLMTYELEITGLLLESKKPFE